MKKTVLIGVLAGLAVPAHAATDLIDTARVISATPIIERVSEPRQECEPASAPAQPAAQERDFTGAVVGGIAGGLLGAQVGRGNGRTAAAAVGAAVGAMAGDTVQNRQRAATAPAPACRTVEVTREVTRGYTVVYHYNGRDITTTLPYRPGATVQVGVGVVDGPAASAAPTAGMLGANVRDVTPPPAPVSDAGSAPVVNTGGYPYRY